MARIRYALRSLAKPPLLSLVVVLSLGLGIGANTAIFSLLHQVVLSSLPVEKPEQLAVITAAGEFKNGRSSDNDSGGMDHIFSYPLFRELERQASDAAATAVSGLAGFRSLGANLAFRSQTVSGSLLVVSRGYFPLLGVKPLLGRTISPEDDRAGGGNPVAVLSFGYWRDKLGGQADVLNQPIRINGQVFTIVGVAPKGFNGATFGQDPDAYVPICFKPFLTPNWDGTKRWDDYLGLSRGPPETGRHSRAGRGRAERSLQRLGGPAGEDRSLADRDHPPLPRVPPLFSRRPPRK